VTSRNVPKAEQLAAKYGGTLYADRRDKSDKLPFTALVTLVCDDRDVLMEAADVALHIVAERTIKPGKAEVFGLFPLVHHPQKTHGQCDAHWRDVHGPLALVHHAFMSHYVQLSVVQTLSGRPLDGIALCGFNSLEDLRDRFYTEPASEAVIAADIANFADLKKSPRGLIVEPASY
jgi:hypothetical protein